MRRRTGGGNGNGGRADGGGAGGGGVAGGSSACGVCRLSQRGSRPEYSCRRSSSLSKPVCICRSMVCTAAPSPVPNASREIRPPKSAPISRAIPWRASAAGHGILSRVFTGALPHDCRLRHRDAPGWGCRDGNFNSCQFRKRASSTGTMSKSGSLDELSTMNIILFYMPPSIVTAFSKQQLVAKRPTTPATCLRPCRGRKPSRR